MGRRTEAAAVPQMVVLLPDGAAMPEVLATLPFATALQRAASPETAPADAPLVQLHRAPAAALAEALAAGQAPAEALAAWRRDTSELLARARPHRRRLTLIDLDAARAAPAGLIAALANRLGFAAEGAQADILSGQTSPNMPSDATDVLLHLLAVACLATDPAAQPLLDELAAITLPLPGGAAAAPVTQGLARLRALTAGAAAHSHTETDLLRQIEAMQEEAAAFDTAFAAAQDAQARLHTALTESAADRDALQAELARQGAELAEAREQQARLVAQTDQARSAAAALAAECEDLSRQLAAGRTDRDRVRPIEEEAAALAAARDELRSRCTALEQELAQTRGLAEAAETAHAGRDAVLGAEILRLRRAVTAGQAELTRTGTELQALQARLEAQSPPPPAEAADLPRSTAPRPDRKGARRPAKVGRAASPPAEAPPPQTEAPRKNTDEAPVTGGAKDDPRPAAAAGPTRRKPRGAGARGNG